MNIDLKTFTFVISSNGKKKKKKSKRIIRVDFFFEFTKIVVMDAGTRAAEGTATQNTPK